MKKTLCLLAVCIISACTSSAQDFLNPRIYPGVQSVFIDSAKVVYRGYDSITVSRSWLSSGFVFITTTFTNLTISQPSVNLLPLSTTGNGTDTVGLSGLMPGAVYQIVVRATDGVSIDSIVIIDSTLASPPTPVDIGPMITVSNISSYSGLLTVPYQRNGGGTVFVTWQDSASGGSWATLSVHQIVGVNPIGFDTLTVFQSPNTTKWYRAFGVNQMFPSNPDTANKSSVTTLPLLANPPAVDSVVATSITSQGGIVTIYVTADSIGGVLFVETICGGNTVSYTPIAYGAGTNSYQINVVTCGPLEIVTVSIQLISSNPNWSTVTSTATFQTSSGPFEISILNCSSTAGVVTANVNYSSGGYANNGMYLFASPTWDTTFSNPAGYSQIYSGVAQALNGAFTMHITDSLASGTTYNLKAYLFNALGLVETASYCTFTTPGTTSVLENGKPTKNLFFSVGEGMLKYQTGENDILTVIDMTGRTLVEEKVSQAGEVTIDFPSGIYLARIGNKTLKFFVH